MRYNNFNILQEYLPKNTHKYIVELLERYPVKFKIVRPRKTKLGDFKYFNNSGICQITINNNLEPLNFLITTIHEIAHLYNWIEYRGKILPHGIEWKNQYIKLFNPLLKNNVLPINELNLLKKHLKNPKSSSCLDKDLSNYFKDPNLKRVEDIKPGDTFIIKNRLFIMEKKLRKRYLCTEKSSNRKFYINGMAIIE